MWYNGPPAFVRAPAIFTITFYYTIFLRGSQEAKQTNKNPKIITSLCTLPIAAKQKICYNIDVPRETRKQKQEKEVINKKTKKVLDKQSKMWYNKSVKRKSS